MQWGIAFVSELYGRDLIASARTMAQDGARVVEIGYWQPWSGVFARCPVGSPYHGRSEPQIASAVGAAYDSAGVSVRTLHAPVAGAADLASASQAVCEGAVALHKLALQVASILGTRIVVVHPGHHCEAADLGAATERAIASLRALLPAAEELGITLAVENLPPGHVCPSPESLRDLVDEVSHPLVRVCYDTGHANLVSGGVAAGVRVLGERIATFHCHDNDGSADQHRMPGDGTVDWREFALAVRESGYDEPLTLEVGLEDGTTAREMGRRFREALEG